MFASLALSCCLAFAGKEPPIETVAPPDEGEYRRLSQELEKLSSRSAWAGVERTFQALIATRWPMAFEDWLRGAQSARAIGDVLSVRTRLDEANRLREDREVVDWMWEIDTHYGRVTLLCDAKSELELVPEETPFNPDHLHAVEFAISRVAESCDFDGLLPEGNYTFGGRPVKVQPRVMSVKIDLRTEEPKPPKKEKK